ncbi:MAG: MATE family efflux transporter [Bacteroidales bacterium]|nr:MATE family efflux transporter [Bacteroidales bacterium]
MKVNEEKALILGREKIGTLLLQYATPAIIAQIASSLFNVVDRIFIGQGVGALAISGLALTFPFMNLAAAFGALVGVGASALTSIKLGEKDYKTARLVLGNVIILNLIFGILFTIACLPFLEPILYALGGSEQTVGYAKEYMFIILIGNVFTHLYLGLNAVLRSAGYPTKAMYVTIFAVGLNAVLDALFILVFKWGIAGAAWATVITQVIATFVLIFIFLKQNQIVHFTKDCFKLKKKIVFDACAIGMSPFMTNLVACLVVIIVNIQLKKYGGDLAIGAYGIINSIAFTFVMIILGLTQGMQPIIGYNYGAKLQHRVLSTLKKGMIAGFVITTIGFLVAELCPRLIASAFTNDEEMINLSITGFRLFMLAFPIVGMQIVASNFFQAIGKAKIAIFLSLTRQLLFLIPALYLMPLILELNGVWLSTVVADFLSAFVSLWVLVVAIKEMKKEISL